MSKTCTDCGTGRVKYAFKWHLNQTTTPDGHLCFICASSAYGGRLGNIQVKAIALPKHWHVMSLGWHTPISHNTTPAVQVAA